MAPVVNPPLPPADADPVDTAALGAVGASVTATGAAVDIDEGSAVGTVVGVYVPTACTFITGAATDTVIAPLFGTIIPCAAAFAVIELDNAPLAAAVVSLFCNAAKASFGFPDTVTCKNTHSSVN